MSWVDTLVILVCVGFFCAVMYKGLKEPIDQLFFWVLNLFSAGASKVAGGTASAAGEIITYG